MTDQYQSHFDGITARAAASRRDRFVVGLLLGLILGGGWTLLWAINRSAPPATKDLQTSEQKIAAQLQSLQQTLASNHAEAKQAFASEQAETKRLSDQVRALALDSKLDSKLDALQQSFASAQQQSSPVSSELSPAPAKRRR
jgi:predicted PurR-regulated permease PerM